MTAPASERIAIIGGGPAGLMAAEGLLGRGFGVDLYDAMPSLGRKFLLAGVGGMNITHSEAFEPFVARYAERAPQMRRLLEHFGPADLRNWIHGLGIDTFVGSSGRVFPTDMKAAPLLRAWLQRLRDVRLANGEPALQIHVRHRWLGWAVDGALRFATPGGEIQRVYACVVLALGGASWSRLGSNGAWVELLAEKGVHIAPLKPANCGFECHWSAHLKQKFAGAPLKSVSLSFTDLHGRSETRKGEALLTEHGIEGSLIYAFSARLRDSVIANGRARFTLDLLPDHNAEKIRAELGKPRGGKSLSAVLKSKLGLDGAKAALLYETLNKDQLTDARTVSQTLKAIPITVHATRPLDEAISTAGGVPFEELDEHLMLKKLPGVYCCGEMLDWEAPTGGYLLTGGVASGALIGSCVRP